MQLQYCSDLHLEFWENRDLLKEKPLQPAGDILLLAGDIVPFSLMEKYNYFFDLISKQFEVVYWLPGNHEYYHSDAAIRSGTLHEKIRDNVFLVNNISFHHGDVKLIFSTLWSKISPANEGVVQGNVNDFRLIKFNDRLFSPADFNQFHLKSLAFIQEEINKEYYRGDRLNEVFGVELFDFIEGSGIDYWIYGHHHNNIPDFSIGKTKLLTNQVGYVRANEHHSFTWAKTIIL